MFHQTWLKWIACAAAFGGLAAYAILGGFFDREIVIEIAILAILAIALDIVAGYGGMISLCHGAMLGLGAYGFGVAAAIWGLPGWVAMTVGIAGAALFGLIVGAVTAKTAGIFFIMATLAFGQLVYQVFFDATALGGDDGMSAGGRLDLSAIGVNLNGSLEFPLFCIAVLILAYAIAATVMGAGFGRTLVGIRSNETRMRAIGVTVWRVKALAFSVSGALAGLAGTLAAQHTGFVSPDLMDWTVSGEVLVIVILGGLGTLIGPVIGAAVFVALKYASPDWLEVAEGWLAAQGIVLDIADSWHLIVGIALIAAVLAGGRGIYGSLEDWIMRPRRRAADA